MASPKEFCAVGAFAPVIAAAFGTTTSSLAGGGEVSLLNNQSHVKIRLDGNGYTHPTIRVLPMAASFEASSLKS